LQVTSFDYNWIVGRMTNGNGWNLWDEVGDTTIQRLGDALIVPVSKLTTYAFQSSGAGIGTLVYVILPSTWGTVTDSNTYIFRDDFMGASLDTTTNWTRVQSTAGNVEIDTAWQWCKLVGNSSWGTNSLYSKTSTARASGKKMMFDIYTGSNLDVGMFGFSDGAGASYTNLLHGVNFHNNSGSGEINIYEAGTLRGVVGSGFSVNQMYRLRLTIQATTSTCKYEIQGGTQYPLIGSSTWTDITPGTTSNSTTPLYIGAVAFTATAAYIGDARLYT
jgi:hypothetical protein